jgi:hypothetical protein
LSLFVCLKAKKIDTEFVSFSDSDKNLLIEPASPIFSGARATSREMSRDESAIFPDGAVRKWSFGQPKAMPSQRFFTGLGKRCWWTESHFFE